MPIRLTGESKRKVSKVEKENKIHYTPSFATCDLICPSFLTENEKVEWDSFTKMIKDIKGHAVTDADIHLITMAVQSWCNYVKYEKAIREEPSQYILLEKPNKDGETVYNHVKNPNYYQKKVELQNQIDCLTKLGIDPIGRAKVGLARLSSDKRDQDTVLSGILNREGDND